MAIQAAIEDVSYDYIKHQWAADHWPTRMAKEQSKAVARLVAQWLAERGV